MSMEDFRQERIPDKVSLRKAGETDQRFLFDLVRTAMQPVYEASGEEVSRDDDAFNEFQNTFNPDDIFVIQYEGKDIGRLHVSRSSEQIFVGGVHLLPEYQEQGIGATVLEGLIEESNASAVPIILEVRHVNTRAADLYKRLGFVEKGERDNMVIMEYTPRA